MTRTIRVLAILALGWLAAGVSAAHGRTAGEAYADGEARLAEADFRGALQSLAAAARADRGNRQYLQQYLMVRQVVTLRRPLAKWIPTNNTGNLQRLRACKPAANQPLHSTHSLGHTQRHSVFAILGSPILRILV